MPSAAWSLRGRLTPSASRDVAFLILVVAASAGAALSVIAVPLVLGVGAAVLAWRRPSWALEAGAILVLVLRPSLDVFSERRFGLGPLASNPSAVLGLVVLYLAAILALWRASNGSRVWPDRGLWRAHLLLFGAYALEVISGLRLYGGVGAGEGLREGLRVLSIVASFLVVWWWASTTRAYRRGWVYLVAGAAAPIALSVWQLASGQGFSDTAGIYRIHGTFSHPNAYSQYLVPFVLVAVAGLAGHRGLGRLLLGAAAAGLTVLVVLSYTRTAILALIMGLVAMPMLQARRFGFAFMVRAAGITGGLALTAWFAAGGIIRERFSALSIGREALTAARTGEPENSFEWRLVNWGLLISMGMEHPIAGHGAGMTTVLNPLTAENGVAFNAHDDFVRFFFEGGIVGLLLYALYVVRLCRWAVRRAQSVTAEHAATAYAVAGAFLALFLLSGGTTELSLQTADLYQLYGMLALVSALPTSVDRAHKQGSVALAPTAARDREGA